MPLLNYNTPSVLEAESSHFFGWMFSEVISYLCWRSTSSPDSSPLIPCLQLSAVPFLLFFIPPPFSSFFLFPFGPLLLSFPRPPSPPSPSSSLRTCLSLFRWQQQKSPLRRWHAFQHFGRRSHYHWLVGGEEERRGGAVMEGDGGKQVPEEERQNKSRLSALAAG